MLVPLYHASLCLAHPIGEEDAFSCLKVISGHPGDPLHLEVTGRRAPQHTDRQPSPHLLLGCVGPPVGARAAAVVDTASPPRGQPPAPTPPRHPDHSSRQP